MTSIANAKVPSSRLLAEHPCGVVPAAGKRVSLAAGGRLQARLIAGCHLMVALDHYRGAEAGTWY